MYYFYQDTVITVRPGLGEDNFATVKLKPSGSWTAIKSAAMPRVDDFAAAVSNMHAWAKERRLVKADCDVCLDCINGYCTKYKQTLRRIRNDYLFTGGVYMRCNECMADRLPTAAEE